MKSKKLLLLSLDLNIKRGESVVLKLSSIPNSSNVLWKVIPEEGVTLNANVSKASAMFSVADSYSIKATYANVVVNMNVLVTDGVYDPAVNSILFSATGHHLEI
jgi:hypothetical protein